MGDKSVLVIGSANMDLVVQMARYPQPGETIFGSKFGMYPGGKGANQAVACAKLGAETIFVGKMGADIFKDRLIDNMRVNGVGMDELLIDPEEPTGIALIYVDSKGQNEIVVVSGSNMKMTPEDVRSKEKLFTRAGIVLSQMEILLDTVIEAARMTRSHGGTFILNPAPAAKLPGDLLKLIDYLTPNEIELGLLSDRNINDIASATLGARKLIEDGVRNVIVTLGEKGALWVNESTNRHFPSFKVEAVDTTAAGDAFNGAFTNALVMGKTVPAAIDFANRVAAIAVTRLGAQPSMPTLEEMQKLHAEKNNPGR